jgi:hypothetical protein
MPSLSLAQQEPGAFRHVLNALQCSFQFSGWHRAKHFSPQLWFKNCVLFLWVRTPAGVKVRPTHRASFLSRLLVMYPPRTNRATVMSMVDRPTPMCSANFDRVVGRMACK